MNLLITGGAGFIGLNLINMIIEDNNFEIIIVIDKLQYGRDFQEIYNNPNIHFVKGDIKNRELIDEILLEYSVTHIIHLAAESHVDNSIISPKDFINSNIIGTFILLEAFKKHWYQNGKNNLWRFLHVSTDEVFGSLKKGDLPFNESSKYEPNSPYSASKASSDHLVRAWNKTYELPTIITNCSNNYGPFQYPDKFIPLSIKCILSGSEIPVYGEGKNIRDWLFVEDHCSILITLLFRGNVGESYCIGGNEEISNLELIKKISKIIDEIGIDLPRRPSFGLIKFVDDRLGHDFRYAIDSSKLKDNFSWIPKYDLYEGLNRTINWYLSNREWLKT